MPKPRGEQTVIQQGIRVARKPFENFLVVRVCLRVTAIFNHGARAGLLQADAAGIDFDRARERCHSFTALTRLRFRSRDARLDGAIVRIYFGRAQQSRQIAFVSA